MCKIESLSRAEGGIDIGLGANQRYVGYFSKSLHPQGSKFCLLS